MTITTAYLIGTHPYSFRCGEPALITGVVMVKPAKGIDMRPCYELKFNDGAIDYTPIDDMSTYTIVSLGDIVANNATNP